RGLRPAEPDDRSLRLRLLGADLLQRRRPAGPLAQAGADERAGPVHHLAHRERRHVARAVRDHRDQPASCLSAVVVGPVLATFWDWSTFVCTIGLFLSLLFLFLLFLSMISIFECRLIISEVWVGV